MITNEAQRKQAEECIEIMRRSLEDMKKTVMPKSHQWYEVMTEGPIDEINRLQSEIDDYLARRQQSRRGARAVPAARKKRKTQ